MNEYVIFPMNPKEFRNIERSEVQEQFFKKKLKDNHGVYFFAKNGIQKERIDKIKKILFYYDKAVIACADFNGLAKFKDIAPRTKGQGSSNGFILVDPNTIKTFEPIEDEDLRKIFDVGKKILCRGNTYPNKILDEKALKTRLNEKPKKENKLDYIYKDAAWTLFVNQVNKTNLFEQANLNRYEDVHSNFLANILAENNIYGLKEQTLRMFLSLLSNKIKLKDNDQISDIKVTPQYTIKKGSTAKNKRPDIFVSFKRNGKKYHLLIEVKFLSAVESYENGIHQCNEYYNLIEEKFKDDKKLYAFICIDSERQWLSNNDNYTIITFQQLLDDFYMKCYENNECNNKNVIVDYLNSFSGIIDINNNVPNSKLPINPRLNFLAQELWNQYEDLLLDVAEEKYNLKNNVQKLFKQLFLVIYNSGISNKEQLMYFCKKDEYTYTINNELYFDYDIVYEAVEYILNNNPDIDTLEKLEEKDLNPEYDNHKVLVEECDLADDDREYYQYLKVKNKKIFIYNNLNEKEIADYISKIQNSKLKGSKDIKTEK